MSNPYITNIVKLVEQLYRFTFFVQQKNGHQGFINFCDKTGFLGKEDYKSHIAEETRKVLKYNSWNESMIGTGKIADCARAAISKCGNLVNIN